MTFYCMELRCGDKKNQMKRKDKRHKCMPLDGRREKQDWIE